MGVRWLVASLLAGCGFAPEKAPDAVEIDAAPTAWLDGYPFRRAIRVTPQIATTLVDFPVGIIRAADPDLAMHASGADLVVTSNDAVTKLDRELVAFGSSGSIELWVKLPALGPAASTIYLYYGGPAGTNAPSTWSAARGVWHLSDVGAMTKDATGRNDLQSPGPMQTPTPAVGIAGTARAFDGLDDAVGVNDPPDNSLDVGTSPFSFSLWVDVAPTVSLYETPLWKGGTSNGEIGYCFLLGNGNWLAKVDDGSKYVDPVLADAPIYGTWVHLAAVADRAHQTFLVYRDGVLRDQMPIDTLETLDTNLGFDISRKTMTPYQGLIDEARLYPAALSADWIAAEHANLTDPGFVVLGAEERR